MAPAMLPSPTGLASRPAPPPPPPPSNRFRRDPRLAPLYERDIAPVWTQPFGRLLLQQVAPLGKATVLDVMCHTGYPALELLRRYPESRVFAVDSSSALLEVARAAMAKGELSATFSALEKHQREFANGRLAEEREALFIQALHAAGREAEAASRTEQFNKQFPDSLLAP